MTAGAYHVRQPMPTARAIRWTPLRPRAGSVTEDAYAIFVTQSVLRDIVEHVWSGPDEELLGFLLGELCESPDTKTRYIVITAAMRTGYAIPEDAAVRIPEELWHAVHLEARLRRVTLLGWYHSAPYMGDFPTLGDRETHRRQFAEPWMTGLVVVPNAEQPDGGFFRTGDGAAATGEFIPFYELLDDDLRVTGRRKPTLVNWASYETDDPLVRPPEPRPAPAPPPTALQTPGTPAPFPVVFPPEAYEEALPTQRSGRGQRLAFFAGTAALVAAAVLGIATVARWAPSSEPSDAPIPIRAIEPRPSPVTPPTADPATEPLAGASRATGTQPTELAPAEPAPASRITPEPATSFAVQSFDRLGAALEVAIRNYYDRRTDFSLGRLNCDELARGYRTADDAFIQLSQANREASASLSAEQATRYEDLSTAMNAVNVDFDESRCPRP